MIRKPYLILVSAIFAGGCLIFIVNSIINIDAFGIRITVPVPYRRKNYHNGRETIKTEGCTIPDLDPFHDSIISFVKYPNVSKCLNPAHTLLGRNRTTIWIKLEKYVLDYYNITDNISCCYRAFYRPVAVKDITSWNIDNRVKYEDCITFFYTKEVKHEFVRVNCSTDNRPVYEQFFLFAPMKEFTDRGEKIEILNNTGYNVLIIGIDSVSRMNFYRTMPKTATYLKNKGAIEMLGYNKVGRNTFPNLVPMLIGVRDTELSKLCHPYRKATFDNCPFIWHWFKEAGFYTAFTEDSTRDATFNYIKAGFGVAPTDYYTRIFFHESEKHAGTQTRLCMNDVYYYQVILNYIEEITWRLKSRRLFGLFWENSMTHDILNYPTVMDDDYVKMFTNLDKSGYLNQTIVFFVSDHGIRWGPIRSTDQGRLEENLPFLYLLVPPSFENDYKNAYSNLKLNIKRLTTPFDVHETLSDLVDLSNVVDSAILIRGAESYAFQRGISMFLSIPSNRTCGTADIDDQWCTCRKEFFLAKDHPRIVEAAEVALKMINFRLATYPQCAKLKLSEILEGKEMQFGEVERGEGFWREYMITVRTDPGEGRFEVMLRYHSENLSWQIQGMPSRINLYGNQGDCVHDYDIKNFWYCDQND